MQDRTANEILPERTSNKNKNIIPVCIIGDKAVGKTSLLAASISGKFKGWYKEYRETQAPDFFTKDIEVNGENYRFQIWDTVSGDAPFNLHHVKTPFSFFRYKPEGAAIYFACFDLSKESSLAYVDQALTNLHSMQLQPAEVILVGTKSDLTMDFISQRSTELLRKKHGIGKYVRSSAKDNLSLYQVFEETFTQYLDKTLPKPPLQTTAQEDGAAAEAKSQSDVENNAAPEVKSHAAVPDNNLELAVKLGFNLFNRAKQSWLSEHPEAEDAHLCVTLKK